MISAFYLGILLRIGSGGPNGVVKSALCDVHGGNREEKTVLFRSVELTCKAHGTDQISTPYDTSKCGKDTARLVVRK